MNAKHIKHIRAVADTSPMPQNLIYSLKETARFREMLLLGSIAYPIWGLFIQTYFPEVCDPENYRILVAIVPAGFFIISYFSANAARVTRMGFYSSAYAMMLHSSFVVYSENFHWIHLVGQMILISTILQLFNSKKQALIYASLIIIFYLVAVLQSSVLRTPEPIIFLILISGVVPAMSSNLARLKIMTYLKESAQEKSEIFHSMLEGVMFILPNGQISFANSSACRMLDFDLLRIGNKNITEFHERAIRENGSLYSVEEFPCSLAIADGKIHKDFVMGIKTNSEDVQWIRVTAIPIFHRSTRPTAVLLTFLDLSEIKSAERIASESQQRMIASSRLAALGEMAGGVAHEINTPLAAILGWAELMEIKMTEEGTISTYKNSLEKIGQTVLRIKKIIQGLRAFSREGAQDPTSLLNMKELIDDSLALCREKLRLQSISIKLLVPDDLIVEARATQVSQVLLNLIHNAEDALVNQTEKWIEISAYETIEGVEISVADSGPGIPQEIRSKILEPFFTTKAVGKGTGLGLSISMGIMKSHGGRLYLDDKSKNTRFIILFPKIMNSKIESETKKAA